MPKRRPAKKRSPAAAVLLAVLCLLLLAVSRYLDSRSESAASVLAPEAAQADAPKLEVHFLDIGQGDSVKCIENEIPFELPEAPRLAVDRDRHDAEILPRRVRNGPRVADIFDAEQAFGVTGRLFQLRRRNVSGVFFGLREVDGNFEFTVLRVGNPVLILRDAVAADVVAILTELVEVIGRRFRAFCVE